MANMRTEVDTALFTVLNVESLLVLATGGVCNTKAEQNTKPPYVVFQVSAKEDDYYSFTGRGGDAVYIVKAVTQEPWPKVAATIDTEIDSLLQDATLSISGFGQLLCRRQNDIYLTENVGGEDFTHQGGLYSIQADQS